MDVRLCDGDVYMGRGSGISEVERSGWQEAVVRFQECGRVRGTVLAVSSALFLPYLYFLTRFCRLYHVLGTFSMERLMRFGNRFVIG